ncbi:MAG: hypothetical protein R3F20_02705 [Planctomycetota bacterium]
MHRITIPLLAVLATLLVSIRPADAQDALAARFAELADAKDHAKLVELWQANPTKVLTTIDACLEGSLKILESEKPDPKEVETLRTRALFGAIAADQAFGRAIFTDYASSFVGWNEAERKRFREGQKAFGAFRAAIRQEGKLEEALAHATRCYELAKPLGDWWGTAMGLTGIGTSLEKLGKKEDALAAHAASRLIYHDFGLVGAELGNLVAMSRLLVDLDRRPRAAVTIEAARSLIDSTGRPNEAARKELDSLSARLAETR